MTNSTPATKAAWATDGGITFYCFFQELCGRASPDAETKASDSSEAKNTGASVSYSVLENQFIKQLERMGTYQASVESRHANEENPPYLDKVQLGGRWEYIQSNIRRFGSPVRNSTPEEFVKNPHVAKVTRNTYIHHVAENEAIYQRAAKWRNDYNADSQVPFGIYPPAHVRTVEVSHRSDEDDLPKKLEDAVETMQHYMYTQPGANIEDGQEDKELSEEAHGKRPQRALSKDEYYMGKTVANNASSKEPPILGMAFHQVLTLVSFDMRYHPLFFDPKI